MKLGIFAVFQNFSNDGNFFEFFQYVGVGGIAGLGLFTAGQIHLPEEDLAQLAGRIEVKLFIGQSIDLLLQGGDMVLQPGIIGFQPFFIDRKAPRFHIRQDDREGEFHLVEQFFLAVFLDLRENSIAKFRQAGHAVLGGLGVFIGIFL